MKEQNRAIFGREKKRDELKSELSECNVSFRYMGIFKGGRRKELQQEIDRLDIQMEEQNYQSAARVSLKARLAEKKAQVARQNQYHDAQENIENNQRER